MTLEQMLVPIDPSCIATAVDLLVKGFPHRGRGHWESAFERMIAFGGNSEAGVPLGQYLEVGGRQVGVMLTPAALRLPGVPGPSRTINLASMYVEPQHSWRAPLLLRSVTRDRDAIFTDLSATPAVQKMLPTLGFRQVSRGITVNLLPLLAMRTGGCVTDIDQAPQDTITADIRRYLSRHCAFGCVAAAMRTTTGFVPLLFKFRKLRNLPGAVLIYCGKTSALVPNLGGIARFLLGKKRMLLVLDLPMTGASPGFAQPGKTPRFVKGAWPEDSIDYCCSELALFH